MNYIQQLPRIAVSAILSIFLLSPAVSPLTSTTSTYIFRCNFGITSTSTPFNEVSSSSFSPASRRRWLGHIATSTGLLLPKAPARAATSSKIDFHANWRTALSNLRLEKDEVVRVLDANTVKLKRGGLVTFAAVGSPSGYNQQDFSFPECMTKSPSSKTRNLLPAKSRVGVYYVNTYRVDGNKPRSALVVTDKEELLVNLELVKSGFARPVSRGSEEVEQALGVQFIKELREMQQQAKDAGAGFYARCEKSDSSITASEDQFEPLDYTVETKWGDDGGKQVIVNRKDNDIKAKMPANPGDTKGCSDFEYYEDALRWYEAYFPYYGDVAKLDRDGDGVPCPGLPHTQNQDRYRMKVPMVQK